MDKPIDDQIPLLAEVRIALGIENNIRNLQRIRREMLSECLTREGLLAMERQVRQTFRAKRYAVVASGEWWMLGRVLISSFGAYRALASLAMLWSVSRLDYASTTRYLSRIIAFTGAPCST
jgi:hypothetical protein